MCWPRLSPWPPASEPPTPTPSPSWRRRGCPATGSTTCWRWPAPPRDCPTSPSPGPLQKAAQNPEGALRALDHDVGPLQEVGRRLIAVDADPKHRRPLGGHAVEGVEGGQVAPVVAQ